VQREVAYALKREITVIPVLINGAQLPDQELLPDDIKGLVDHQAASVSLAGFRHEMAGLVRDIRSIRTPKPWRLLGATAAILILSATAGISVYAFGFYDLLERTRSHTPSPEATNDVWTNGIWKSRPGEWVMFAVDKLPVAYFINPSSIKSLGDSVTYLTRYGLRSNASASSTQSTAQGAYQDEVQVLNCKKSVFASAERTIYNIDGKILYHFKAGEPESLDLSSSQPIPSGAILEAAEHIVCDEKLRSLLLTSKARFSNEHLSYLANSADGDGTFLYGSIWPATNPAYQKEAIAVVKKNNDHTFADVFPGQNVLGLPTSYRTIAGNVQMDCREKKVLAPADEYYDRDDHLVFLTPQKNRIMDAKYGTLFGNLLDVACSASANLAGNSAVNVAGNYEGMNFIKYVKGGEAEQKVSITTQQNGSDLKISFQSANAATGEGTGKLTNNRAESISLHSTTPGCPGSYDGSMSFGDNSLSWSYNGTDCGGAMEGHGTATKVTSGDLNH
jgi:hypothetical protein